MRASRLELQIKAGNKLAKIARHLVDRLDEYLSATQLGITLASLGLGWVGESVAEVVIAQFLDLVLGGDNEALAHKIALPVGFLIITILHIVFGELAPKSMAIQKPEKVSLFVSIPLRAFYILFKPFIWLLNSTANAFIRSIGFRPAAEEQEIHSPEEILYLIGESAESGIIKSGDRKLLENVFDFSGTPVKQIMVPRGKIFGIELSMKIEDIIDDFIDLGYSRIPVYEEDIDNIVGVVYAKDVLSVVRHGSLIVLKDVVRPPYYVGEDIKINLLLREMQRNKIHLAIVRDEFGGTAGLVTLEDIIEEIVGEIQDEYDEETPAIVKKSENEFSVKADLAVDDANDYLPGSLPEDDEYETVGGLIISFLDRIPESGEEFELFGYRCKILKRTKRQLELISLTFEGLEDEEED